MAWALVTGQTASLNNATTITPTVAVPNVIGSGNLYLGAVGYDSAQTLNSVTDDKGNTYNLKSTITETTDLIKITQFELGNIANGPKTITFHFSAATDSCAVVAEFSGGLAAADPNDGTTGQFQAAVASGANNVTSTAITTTVNGDLIVGASLDGASLTAPTAGTSPNAFTSIGTASDATTIFGLRLEYFVQTTAGSIAATFGIGVNGDSAATNVVAFKPAAAAASYVPYDWWHQGGPVLGQ